MAKDALIDIKSVLDLCRFLMIFSKAIDLGLSEEKLNEGLKIYKSNISAILEIGTLFEEKIVKLNPALKDELTVFKAAKRLSDVESLTDRLKLINGSLKYLNTNQTLIKEIIGEESGLALSYAKDLIASAIKNEEKTEDVLEEFTELANMPTFLILKTGVKSPQKWIDSLLEEFKGYMSPVEKMNKKVAALKSYLNVADAIKNLDTELRSLDPRGEEYKKKSLDRYNLLNGLITVVNNTEGSQNGGDILNQITAHIAKVDTYRTTVGQTLKLTAEQEDAMVAGLGIKNSQGQFVRDPSDTGKVLIAAGAGSGKTRVLAGRVAYLIKELNVPASSIMATSFTRLSAAELIERIEKPEFAGSNALSGGNMGFGTSHSIGSKLLRLSPKYARNKVDLYLDSKIFKLAVLQVGMYPNGPVEKLTSRPLFRRYNAQDFQNYRTLIQGFISKTQQWIPMFAPGGKAENAGQLKILQEDLKVFNEILMGAKEGPLSPYDLTISQKTYLNNLFNEKRGKIIFGDLLKAYQGMDRLQKFAAAEDEESSSSSKMTDSTYYKTPANLWFNIGLDAGKLAEEIEKGKAKGIPVVDLEDRLFAFQNGLSEGIYEKNCSKYYNSLLSAKDISNQLGLDPNNPDDVKNPNFAMLAIYGAYLWIKQNDPWCKDTISGDDMLVKAIGVLLEEPAILDKMQQQFKHIMVDEAQDLNVAQHTFFGLIAGTINPGTLVPYTDGRPMKASSFAFIGDDKQAIYEFRGATPQTFIDKSDLKQGGDFKTKLITANFRSGSTIVEAANRLIEHNDQIPMTCSTVPSNQHGLIYTEFTNDKSFQESAVANMKAIKTRIENGESPRDFGVACRSGSQAKTFLLQAIKNKIPFRSQLDPLSSGSVKAILSWLEFISLNDTEVSKMNSLVLKLFTFAPTFFLGHAFKNGLSDYLNNNRNANLLKVISETPEVLNMSKNQKNIEYYAKILTKARTIKGTVKDTLDELLKLKDGKGESFGNTIFGFSDEPLVEGDIVVPTAEEAKNEKEKPKEEGYKKNPGYEFILELLNFGDDALALTEVLKKIEEFKEQMKSNKKEAAGMLIDTMHQWKGLECKHLLTVFSNMFPNPYSPEDEESDRRLAYVALTRGQESVKVIANRAESKNNTIPVISKFINEACIPDFESAVSQFKDKELPSMLQNFGDVGKKKASKKELYIDAQSFLNDLVFSLR